MIIDIWADVAHLDSYLAKVAWESALAEWEHSDDVQIVWHSYQVDRPSTYDAHRLLHLAGTTGRGDVARELMMKSFVTEEESSTDRAVLLRLAGEAGLDPVAAEALLDSDQHGYDVRVDEATAAQIGFAEAPYLVIDRKYGVGGAQPTAVYLSALNYARDHENETPEERTASACGGACGSCGCGA
ncbi:DsbA family protein [Nocardioides sp. 616]|uniref:DsbA family oxidoreductase n=1 Tax=Nocardioides sp. 616 TaxID=2268090 RepID=UPI001966A0DE|nr:DsbA family protein [Nocardioides sp. 616]